MADADREKTFLANSLAAEGVYGTSTRRFEREVNAQYAKIERANSRRRSP